jgi:hypothetical protein
VYVHALLASGMDGSESSASHSGGLTLSERYNEASDKCSGMIIYAAFWVIGRKLSCPV